MFPTIIDWNGVVIYSYPLLMGLAWGLSYQLTLGLLEDLGKPIRGFKGLYWGAFIFSWIGAKLFFLLTSGGLDLAKFAGSSNFWLGGGFVFYGGLITGFLYILFYCKVLKLFPWENIYILLPSLAISHGIGRIGCFLAGCCYGTICELPWKIFLHGGYRHPVQLYEALLLIFLGTFLIKQIHKGEYRNLPKKVMYTYFLSYSTIRFLLEFLRGDKIRGLYQMGLSSSQLVSIFLVVTVGCLFMRDLKKGNLN